MGKESSKISMDIFQSCASFSELPDESDPWDIPKIFLHQTNPFENSSSEGDLESLKYEEYLRLKWECTEAMPEAFDPDKLEVVLQAQHKYRAEREEAVRTAIDILTMSEAESPELNTDIQPQEQGQAAFNNLYSSENLNASSEFLVSDISVTESLDSDERLEEYENEVIIDVASATNITHVISSDPTIIRRSTTALIERIPTSRIKAGSRPPLSRSAYSSDAVPKLRDEYSWKRPSITLSNYPPAPDYFPFKSSVASV